MDLVVVGGVFVAGSGCGIWIWNASRFPAAGRIQQILLGTGLGLGFLGYVAFAMGMTSLLSRTNLVIVYVVLVVVGIVGWLRVWNRRTFTWREIRDRVGGMSTPAWVCLGFLGLLASLNLLAALAPVVGVDEMVYRLASARIYLAHEHLDYIRYFRWMHMQPQQIQMVQLWGMSIGSDSSAQVVQWGMGLLLLGTVVDWARRVMPLAWSLLGGAIFYCYSDVIVLSGRALPDLANGLFMVLAVVAWLNWLETGIWRWLVPAALLAGLFAAGARLPGAYGAIALSILTCVYAYTRFRTRFLSAFIRGLGVGLLAFLVLCPWLVKAYVQTGNPIWPFGFTVFGAQDWSFLAYEEILAEVQGATDDRLSVLRFLTSPWDLTMSPKGFRSGVIGPLFLAVLPLALVLRLPKRLSPLMVASGVLYVLWYVSFPRLRAFIPGIALLAVGVSYVLWRLWEMEGLPVSIRRMGVGLAGVWLVVGLGTAARYNLRPALVSLGQQEEKLYLSQRLREPDLEFFWYDDYEKLNTILPEGSRVLIFETRGYYLKHEYRQYYGISQMEQQPERLRDPDYVIEKVRETGCNYVARWPELRYMSGYRPDQWLTDTIYEICDARWPVVYRSPTMVVHRVLPTP